MIELRNAIFSALSGLTYDSKTIPVFDEVVNPSVDLPSAGGAEEVYIVLQDQQTNMNETQTVCSPRFNLSLTIRIVTIWGTVGSKTVCAEIATQINNLLRTDRGGSKINGIDKIELVSERVLTEHTDTNIAFSNILILNFIKNG